jgi:hypothetical protein
MTDYLAASTTDDPKTESDQDYIDLDTELTTAQGLTADL